MVIRVTGGKVHWNYFIAMEHDLEIVSRYIEFSDQNLRTFSIELAHLLLATASEVDVVAKLVCAQIAPHEPNRNIDNYRTIIMNDFPDIARLHVHVPRYGLSFSPWENWSDGSNPNWWRSYNNVKHERNAHFDEATLQNTLNAMGGLLILVHRYYRAELGRGVGDMLGEKDTSFQLVPESVLIRLPDEYYHEHVYM